MREKLTNTSIKSLPPQEREYVVWDSEVRQLGVRVHPGGQKTFIIMYRVSGRLRKKTLAPTHQITIEVARRLAANDLVGVAAGKDPALKKTQMKSDTFDDLSDAYLEWASLNKKSWKGDEYRLKQVRAIWGKRRVDSIKRIDVEKLHNRIGERGQYEANRFLALLSKMFSLAARWGFIPENAPNPARGIERFREHHRDRWVTPTEMPRLIDAIQAESNPYHRAGLLLYLLTGMRNKELIQIPWSDVDMERQEIRLPDTKAGRSFLVKLSPAAFEVFKEIPRTNSPWVFPSPDPAKHLTEFPRKAWERVRLRAGMPDLRIHDLRRTFGSWLATQGTPLKVIAALLNQTSQSITDTVYAHLADDPLREATASVGDNLIRFTRIKEKIG